MPVTHEAVARGTAQEYTAQHSNAPVNGLEQELLNRSPHNARVRFKLEHEKSSVISEPSVRSLACKSLHLEYSDMAEILEHDFSEISIVFSKSSYHNQISDLASSVAVGQLMSVMFVQFSNANLDEARHRSIGDKIRRNLFA